MAKKQPKVRITKESETQWMVWTVGSNGEAKVANIVAFEDWFMGKVKRRFRVDVNGKTEHSLIDHFQTAKALARKAVI